jgi:alkanesulfonate monooxygenase SsuD/methylene tetrahydromethanopterin reductase-like flavin-dependent oxidoreductase (luciferase family)
MTPAPDAPYPRIIAANGPRLLSLAAELADGALPAGLPPEFTARARTALGPDRLLVVALSTIIDTSDRAAALAAARQAAAASLTRPSYAAAVAVLHPANAHPARCSCPSSYTPTGYHPRSRVKSVS